MSHMITAQTDQASPLSCLFTFFRISSTITGKAFTDRPSISFLRIMNLFLASSGVHSEEDHFFQLILTSSLTFWRSRKLIKASSRLWLFLKKTCNICTNLLRQSKMLLVGIYLMIFFHLIFSVLMLFICLASMYGLRTSML